MHFISPENTFRAQRNEILFALKVSFMASLFSMSQGAKDHVRLKIHDREVFQKAFFTFLFFFVAFFGIFPHFLIRQSTRVKRGEEIKTKIFEIVILHCRYKQKKAGNKRIFSLSTFLSPKGRSQPFGLLNSSFSTGEWPQFGQIHGNHFV